MIEEGPAQRRRTPRRGSLPIADIAQLAGVSAPTMSKVLNGRAGVGEQTRQRVEALLRAHDYRRPIPIRMTQGIEVVFHGMLGSIALDVLRGVEEVAGARDLTVGFTDVSRRVLAGLPWVEPLLPRRPTGVITVFSGVTAEHCDLLSAGGIPLVALDPIGDLYPTPAVGSNNWGGALEETRHLLDLGHRRIGTITGLADPLDDPENCGNTLVIRQFEDLGQWLAGDHGLRRIDVQLPGDRHRVSATPQGVRAEAGRWVETEGMRARPYQINEYGVCRDEFCQPRRHQWPCIVEHPRGRIDAIRSANSDIAATLPADTNDQHS
ncbi:MAG: LacI family DNA-binding transcriptional regulator [Micromonosporaceae bacterium]|nr:LacI family DNA-binding transcriptional regulator [Micromonosporaceae bacterium]